MILNDSINLTNNKIKTTKKRRKSVKNISILPKNDINDVPSWVREKPKLRHNTKYNNYKIKINFIDTKSQINQASNSFVMHIDSIKIKNYTIFNLKSDIIKNNYIKNATYINLNILHKNIILFKMNDLVIKYLKQKKDGNMIIFQASLINVNNSSINKDAHSQWF